MEVEGGQNSKLYVLLYEFMGTALLLLAVNLPAQAGA